jgi:hypothetical protein
LRGRSGDQVADTQAQPSVAQPNYRKLSSLVLAAKRRDADASQFGGLPKTQNALAPQIIRERRVSWSGLGFHSDHLELARISSADDAA